LSVVTVGSYKLILTIRKEVLLFFFLRLLDFSGCWSDTGGNGSMITEGAKVVCHWMFKNRKAVPK
jgi:hypothetical protein